MPAFIEECRYEWKRLGVPDSMAEEMATDLEADLAEAEADGASGTGFCLLLALQTLGSSSASSSSPVHVMPVQITPARRVSVPNVVGMTACKAARTVARSSADGWRIAGFQHGYECDQIVVGQAPVGDVKRRDGHPVIVTLRLGRRR
jgi:hypothetical protein